MKYGITGKFIFGTGNNLFVGAEIQRKSNLFGCSEVPNKNFGLPGYQFRFLWVPEDFFGARLPHKADPAIPAFYGLPFAPGHRPLHCLKAGIAFPSQKSASPSVPSAAT